MTPESPAFSARHGYTQRKDIVYRGEIPAGLRPPLLEILQWYADPNFLWGRIERLFSGKGTDMLLRSSARVPGAAVEERSATAVRRFLVSCPWYYLYDLIEDIFAQLSSGEVHGSPDAGVDSFQRDVNGYFIEAGIGWQLVNGRVVVRGQEILEDTVNTAATELRDSERPTAAKCIQEALQALSQRPEPNLRGAIVKGMGALESVARDLVGDPKTSLDEIFRLYPGLLPKPVDSAVSQLWSYAARMGHVWGYADNQAWFMEEGCEPVREEAEMIVGLAAVIATYLARKRSLVSD